MIVFQKRVEVETCKLNNNETQWIISISLTLVIYIQQQ